MDNLKQIDLMRDFLNQKRNLYMEAYNFKQITEKQRINTNMLIMEFIDFICGEKIEK